MKDHFEGKKNPKDREENYSEGRAEIGRFVDHLKELKEFYAALKLGIVPFGRTV